ncbi:hypothetical protein TheveDRAFT_1648 [Thermanaerovibrio velox DSM 12556]|uniref:Peptidase M15A C-terminal domain-containing protein n=1 Tax=Thermanaerovibrio velox DSM 12556 TaxID=926567 RepID=H0UQK2_9BACT|nr:D-Ala-D-Ala carboxypeptidase family metallohydrolase [Thermanaerovibrio velox]EHM10766.1 hypothetical protein TheveDRAFT_1648 [Thermanaerovibrio velox DSM 12556]
MADLRRFKCRCCGECRMDPRYLKLFDALEDRWGPLRVTSGYRCQRHNRAVGGVAHSLHTKGLAADVACVKARQPELGEMAKALGFNQVVLYPMRGFVHLGVKT